MDEKQTKCNVVNPGEGESFWVLGDRVTVKLATEHAEGRYAVIETGAPPGNGPPPHVHSNEDELFYVLEGDLEFILNDQIIQGSKGFVVYLPKGSTHTFKNVGKTPARFVVAAAPGGFERFFAEVGIPCSCPAEDPTGASPPVTQADIDRLMQGCGKHGLEMRFDHRASQPAKGFASDRQYWVWGEHVNVRMTSDESNGNFCLAEVTCQPGGGVPPHLHIREDEMFYVVEGTWEFLLDDKKVTAMPGSFIRVPRGTFHGFRNIGPVTGKLLDYHSPGGFERFFTEAGTPCKDISVGPPAGTTEMSQVLKLVSKHGMRMPDRLPE